jgi:hypothetical protein
MLNREAAKVSLAQGKQQGICRSFKAGFCRGRRALLDQSHPRDVHLLCAQHRASEFQHRVVQTFHYVLKPGAYLFVEPSEKVTRDAGLFAVLDKKHRILQTEALWGSV